MVEVAGVLALHRLLLFAQAAPVFALFDVGERIRRYFFGGGCGFFREGDNICAYSDDKTVHVIPDSVDRSMDGFFHAAQ